MKRSVTVMAMAFMLMSSAAHARFWEKNSLDDYDLTSGKESLQTICFATADQIKRPYFTLFTKCGADCPDDAAYDDSKLSSVIIDGTNYPVKIRGADPSYYLITPAAKEEQFYDAMTKAKNVVVYSSQLKPAFTEFKDIENSDVLKQYYAECTKPQDTAETDPSN